MACTDQYGRPLRTLRLSVTDRCNLRCEYCMPEEEYAWLPRGGFLTFPEIDRLVDAFTALGLRRIRLTGGEPLLRPDLPELIARLAPRTDIDDLALTTNGVLLEDLAVTLRRAGLRRLTVSLDTSRPERFESITRRDMHARVLAGLAAAAAAGFDQLKIDAVILRGSNDRELPELLALGARYRAEVRFIEYMDVPGATRWSPEQLFPREAILETIAGACGPVHPAVKARHAPADRWTLPDGTAFGIIASTTTPFCSDCDRSRVSADGQWFLCLYAPSGIDLREPLRQGASREELASVIRGAWTARRDRGAEERARLADRRQGVPLEVLRQDPHREMHTRGG